LIRALGIGRDKNVYFTESLEQIRQVQEKHQVLLWLDVLDPTPEDLEFLGSTFGFAEICLKDCGEYTKNPKLDEYDDYLFIVTHVLHEAEELMFPEMDIFLSHNYLVTVHYYHVDELEQYWHRLLQRLYDGPMRTDFLLYHVITAVADSFHKVVEEIAAQIEDLEEDIIVGNLDNILPQITTLRRRLIYFRRQLSSEVAMLEKLTQPDIEFFTEESRAYLRDAMERFQRVLHFVDVNRELIAALFETYLSVISLRMTETSAEQNRIMQRLTVITAVFMPLTLLAGIYGMNFEFMPELDWKYGYFAVLLVMLLLGLGLYRHFKKRGWLD
jgi:magnesium transporter